MTQIVRGKLLHAVIMMMLRRAGPGGVACSGIIPAQFGHLGSGAQMF